MIGVKAKADSFVAKHPERFEYMIRDCIYSGLDPSGNQQDFELMRRNCKTNDIQVQLLSTYATPDLGHIMMFEALAWKDGTDAYITCNVDICVKDKTGQLIWPECKQSCDGINWLDQSDDEVEAFGVTAAPLDAIDETEAPATTAFVANADPDNTVMPTTFHITEAVTEPMDDILSFKQVCIENVKNDDFFAEEAELFELCKYIKALFPEDFDLDIGKFE